MQQRGGHGQQLSVPTVCNDCVDGLIVGDDDLSSVALTRDRLSAGNPIICGFSRGSKLYALMGGMIFTSRDRVSNVRGYIQSRSWARSTGSDTTRPGPLSRPLWGLAGVLYAPSGALGVQRLSSCSSFYSPGLGPQGAPLRPAPLSPAPRHSPPLPVDWSGELVHIVSRISPAQRPRWERCAPP